MSELRTLAPLFRDVARRFEELNRDPLIVRDDLRELSARAGRVILEEHRKGAHARAPTAPKSWLELATLHEIQETKASAAAEWLGRTEEGPPLFIRTLWQIMSRSLIRALKRSVNESELIDEEKRWRLEILNELRTPRSGVTKRRETPPSSFSTFVQFSFQVVLETLRRADCAADAKVPPEVREYVESVITTPRFSGYSHPRLIVAQTNFPLDVDDVSSAMDFTQEQNRFLDTPGSKRPALFLRRHVLLEFASRALGPEDSHNIQALDSWIVRPYPPKSNAELRLIGDHVGSDRRELARFTRALEASCLIKEHPALTIDVHNSAVKPVISPAEASVAIEVSPVLPELRVLSDLHARVLLTIADTGDAPIGSPQIEAALAQHYNVRQETIRGTIIPKLRTWCFEQLGHHVIRSKPTYGYWIHHEFRDAVRAMAQRFVRRRPADDGQK